MKKNSQKARALGQAIAEERARQGMSQTQLAYMVGYSSHAHISRIENGHKLPSLDALFSIADALDVKVSYLFTKI